MSIDRNENYKTDTYGTPKSRDWGNEENLGKVFERMHPKVLGEPKESTILAFIKNKCKKKWAISSNLSRSIEMNIKK